MYEKAFDAAWSKATSSVAVRRTLVHEGLVTNDLILGFADMADGRMMFEKDSILDDEVSQNTSFPSVTIESGVGKVVEEK